MRNYGAYSVKTDYTKELAVRILLAAAARYESVFYRQFARMLILTVKFRWQLKSMMIMIIDVNKYFGFREVTLSYNIYHLQRSAGR